MYGTTQASGAAGASLALTGLNVGASVLTAVGLFILALGMIALARRGGKDRP